MSNCNGSLFIYAAAHHDAVDWRLSLLTRKGELYASPLNGKFSAIVGFYCSVLLVAPKIIPRYP